MGTWHHTDIIIDAKLLWRNGRVILYLTIGEPIEDTYDKRT